MLVLELTHAIFHLGKNRNPDNILLVEDNDDFNE